MIPDTTPLAADQLAVLERELSQPVPKRGRRPRHLPHAAGALLSAFAVLGLSLFGCLAPEPVPAAVRPSDGFRLWNTPVCGANAYVPVDLGKGDYFNVYDSQAGNTCVNSQRHRLSWFVASWAQVAEGWQMPNISSGWEWGRYTCDDGRSAYPTSKGSECMRYPVMVRDDGSPLTSASYYPHLIAGNVAYDIWFNQTDAHPSQDDGAEIMIWLDDPQEAAFIRHAYLRTAWVGGRAWEVCGWTMHHNGESWNYVAYVAPERLLSVSGLWLNDFFREAEAHGELSASWYLTAIDFGAEINETVTGPGFDVASYSLADVR